MWTAALPPSSEGRSAGRSPAIVRHAAVELDFDARRVETRGEGQDLHRLRRAADVHCGEAAAAETADAGGQVERIAHLALQAVELGKHIAGKQGWVHSHASSVG
jgi:hypothetical protein